MVSLARVTWRSPGRFAVCLAAGLLTVLFAPFAPSAGATARAAASDASPLQVTIDTLHPSTVPAHGRVTITGQITNTSDSAWTNLQVYMLTSATPITSGADLAAASATDPTAEVGSRLASTGLYEQLGDLAPGESTSYALSVSRPDLGISGDPGVYWFGVHVLGAENGLRDAVADGRARTFLPLLPKHAPRTRLALVVPVREPVRRNPDGQLLGPHHWQRTLGPDGRLDRLIRLTSPPKSQAGHPAEVPEAPRQPVTWVVDPAVLDAARSMARQNPPLDIAPTTGETGSASPSPSASPTPSPSSSGSPSTPPAAQGDTPAAAAALDATAWIQLFQRQAAAHAVMTLPYGDLDVAPVMRRNLRSLLKQGRRLSARTMRELAVTASPIIAPAHGLLPRRALRRLGPDHPVLLSDRAFPSAPGPVVGTPRGGHAVLTDSAAGTGGPTPGRRFTALAVRQRILSEAALHALSPDHRKPLVVSTPQHWNPGPDWGDANFFGGLDVPWLTMVDLPGVVDSAGPVSAPQEDPVYPRSQQKHEVPFANLLATQELTTTGDTFARLLTRNDTVDQQLAAVAMLASGDAAKAAPTAALDRARRTTRHVRTMMKQVRIEGPPFVTMSSEQGPIQITLINGLDEEVTVEVHATTRTPDVTIASSDPVTLGPGRRASVRLTAKARDIGVHAVTLVATDAAGNPLGSTAVFNVRTSQVGLVIWVIMGIGGTVLLLAIGVRLARRVQRRKATHGPLLPGDNT